MKQSNFFIPTQKEVSSKAIAKSHIYALRAGYMHQNASGIFTYLPLANLVLENIIKIVDEELLKINANKITMPLLEPAELWEESGRWDSYGDELFRVTDRHDRKYALAPTHEELITDVLRNQLNSYKKYPVNLYQLHTKLRDEQRPRYGFLRGREFIMMDGYSYHTSMQDLEKTYADYYESYKKILDKIGIDYKVVEADNGSMGGSKSHEFMALADIGEDTIVYEENSEIAYNLEIAPNYFDQKTNEGAIKDLELITTTNIKTVEQLEKELNYKSFDMCKAVYYETIDKELIIAFVSGDNKINEVKLSKVVNAGELQEATSEVIQKYKINAGFLGPIDLEENIKVYYDHSVFKIVNGVCGGNEKDKHYTGFNFSRDVSVKTYDLREIKEGELMSKNGLPVKFKRGIEIGHIFMLGDKYTKSMKMTYLDENQKNQTPVMGCYGMGISRLLSAIIEQNNDDNGIIMPKSISPFDIHMIVMDYTKNEEQKQFANDIYNKFMQSDKKVLLDDRNERPGIKFKDADLIGIPIQIVIGKKYEDNIVELKLRNNDEKVEVSLDELLDKVNNV